jgi:hypothetical protein
MRDPLDDRFDLDDDYDFCVVPGQLTDDEGRPFRTECGTPMTVVPPGVYERTVYDWTPDDDGIGASPPCVELRRVPYAEIAARLRHRQHPVVRPRRAGKAGRSRARVARRRRTRSSSRAGPDRLDDDPARPRRRSARRAA